MKTLKFIVRSIRRHMQNRAHSVRVMGCELWVNPVSHAQQFARASDIGHVRRGFGCEDRKTAKPFNLGAFHLCIPVSAFDQTYHDAAIKTCGESMQMVNHKRRARAVSLHDDAKPVPPFKRFFTEHRFDHIERKREAIRLLCIDVKTHICRFRQKRERA